MKFLLSICLLFSISLSAQNATPTTAINGTYFLMEAERGIKTKIFEYGEHNGVKLLAVAACAKCIPGVYTYQKEDSEMIDRPVFFNKIGLYLLAYDEDSFVMVMPAEAGSGDWTNFSFANFYSKSATKVASMTAQKVKDYILKLSEE